MVNSLHNSVGIACVYVGSGYGYYWVQCFGSSQGSGIASPACDDAATVVVNVPDSFIDSYYYEDDPIYLGIGESQALSVVDALIFGTFQDGQIVSGVLSFYSTFLIGLRVRLELFCLVPMRIKRFYL